ncbi:MAG: hypothetical protein R3352_01930 [Salinisphaeraceae bacterium]|nr:hypothetical protein [Salinisphaeraceae bacterium]
MHSHLTTARQGTMIKHGALVFSGGLLAGLMLTFSLLGHIEVWPIPGQLNIELPGTSRAWLRSHLGLILNGIGIWVFMLVGAKILLSEQQQKLYVISVLITAWFNSAGFIIGTLFGVHGLHFGGAVANTVTYLFFLVAVITVVIQVALVLSGAKQLKAAAN